MKGSWIRIFISVLSLAFFLYQMMVQQNRISSLRLEIPKLEKECNEIEEENTRMVYEIDAFENPLSLIELSRKPEYRFLKNPLASEIIILKVPKNILTR